MADEILEQTLFNLVVVVNGMTTNFLFSDAIRAFDMFIGAKASLANQSPLVITDDFGCEGMICYPGDATVVVRLANNSEELRGSAEMSLATAIAQDRLQKRAKSHPQLKTPGIAVPGKQLFRA